MSLREGEVEAGEEKGTLGLLGVQSLGSTDVLKVFVISPHQKDLLLTVCPFPYLLSQ